MDGTKPGFASNQLHADTGAGEFGSEVDPSAHRAPPAAPPSTNPAPPVEVTVEDLVFLNVPLAWQEAAALVVELASVVPAGAAWPDPAHAILMDTGEIVPAPLITLSGDPVCHAAELLERLLALTRLAPAELKVLVNKNIGTPPAHASLDSFRKAVSYFTRPSPLDDTAAVHGRAADVLQKRLLEREFDRVRHKSVRALGDDGTVTRFPLLGRVRPEWVQGALVVLLCLLLAASGTALISLAVWGGPLPWSTAQPGAARRPPLTRDGTTTERGGSNGTDVPDAAAATPERVVSGRAPHAPAPTAAKTPQSGQAPSTAMAPSGSSVNAAPASEFARDRFWSVTVREVKPDATPAGPGEASPGLPRSSSPELFSPADPDVEPAALVRPQMPSPRTPSSDRRDSVFDLVIDQNGRVEQVHLLSPANRFNDRMLVAAAKAWQFLPAIKDGQPVRYKLQIRISP